MPHDSSLALFNMALLMPQLQRRSFSLFCRSRGLYIPFVRLPTVQKLQRKVFSSLKSGEEVHSTSEADGRHQPETPRIMINPREPRTITLENNRRLHVSNLLVGTDKYTTEDTLFNYFAQFGEVENLEFFCRKVSKLPRGFAFVTFRDVESAKKVLADAESHVIDGRNITISLPIKTKKSAIQGKSYSTVVVNNILKETTKQAIEQHFSQFGKVDAVMLAHRDVSDGNLSSYYVMFSTLSAAKKAQQEPRQRIADQVIDSQVTEFTQTKNFTGKAKCVLVRPVPDHVTVEDLRDYFTQFGDVKLVELKIDYYDVPYPEKDLNIAFVHFYDDAIVDEITKTEDYILNGSEVKVLKSRNLQIQPGRSHKCFVSMEGLPVSTKWSDVKDFFHESFGMVPSYIFMKKLKGADNKAVCIVSFFGQGQVDVVLSTPTVTFRGITVHFRKLFWSSFRQK